jgi:alcohol dehydrogenase
MRAALLEVQGEPLRLRDDVEIAAPGPGQVRVDVSHCGLCPRRPRGAHAVSYNSLREIPRLLGLWRAGRLDLERLVTARRPLAEVNAALEDLAAGRGIRTVLSLP